MLNDDLLVNYGQKMLKDRQVRGEIVVIKGEGDGFFYDPINKFMIRIQKGKDVCLLRRNYDERGRCLLFDYTSGACFLANSAEFVNVETN